LKGNGLKVLDDGLILDSWANLAASLAADWDSDARKACEKLLAKLDPVSPLYAGLAAQLPV
jgi:ATP phosphoribosyltransferase